MFGSLTEEHLITVMLALIQLEQEFMVGKPNGQARLCKSLFS